VTPPRVAMVTYSTKPRGGVVHALELSAALRAIGQPLHLFALGAPDASLPRPVTVPHTFVEAPPRAPSLTERVLDAAAALERGLGDSLADFDIVHAQDCVAARAVLALRAEGRCPPVLRTVHHVDDFTTPTLVECQRRSIVEPDHVVVVSEHWRRLLRRDFGIEATVIRNGVDAARFAHPDGVDPAALRAGVPARERFLFLTVGGIEPRKGSLELLEACARLVHEAEVPPVLAIVGGHSFQDHTPYRERALGRADALGLELGRDVLMLGTVSSGELVGWYHAADGFVFPSVNEGWGLAVLEAMAAGLPVIATSIPVFGEYLRDGTDALLVPPGASPALADAMHDVMQDEPLRVRLAAAGRDVAARYTWDAAARRHASLYASTIG
jgi:glycosyltransferase-like protein